MPTKPPTPCSHCGQKATYRGRCAKHARQAQRHQGSPTERGYGTEHRKLRDEWAKLVATGTVTCAREGCGRLLTPGEPWDLGHDDNDRTKYRGPECRKCNRSTKGRLMNQVREQR